MEKIDLGVVKENVAQLDKLGKTNQGGTSRLSYSEAWRQAQLFVKKLMEAAGMTVERDAIGNLIGTYVGCEPTLPYLMVGSHLDTVPEGGSLDGALGVVAAIECIRTWHISGYRPLRTVKIIGTIEEEGTLFGMGCLGSRFMAGEMTTEKLDALRDKQGKSLAAYFADQGMDYAALGKGWAQSGALFAFLEMHVEQGYELDLSGEACAIVTDIVGIDRHWVTIRGHANHAGTTRMDRRKDALVAAAALIQALYQGALNSKGLYVATVGACKVAPGATNVIPGEVELTVETRAAQDDIMEKIHLELSVLLQKLEVDYGVKATVTQRRFAPAVSLSTTMIEALARAAQEMQIKVNKMPSWAGHDAKIMANITPCGMLFVPSVNGISHSPEEATRWADVETGMLVFRQAMQELAAIR